MEDNNTKGNNNGKYGTRRKTKSVSAVDSQDNDPQDSYKILKRSTRSKSVSFNDNTGMNGKSNVTEKNMSASVVRDDKATGSQLDRRNSQKVKSSSQSKNRKSHRSLRDIDEDSDDDNHRPCSKCQGEIDSHTRAMSCEFCDTWTCLYCMGVSVDMYDMMIDNEMPNFLWTCDSCVHAIPTIKNMGKMLKGVQDEQKDCRVEIDKLSTKFDALESSVDDKIKTAIDDYRDREARKCNIILHNIPESCKETAKERVVEDLRRVDAIVEEGLELEEYKIQSIVRLGKRVDGKTRLTRVTFDTTKSKRDALSNAKKLFEIESWKRVFITPDLPPQQRQKNRELRDELRRRLEEGESNLVIRRGEIVKMNKGNITEEESVSSVRNRSILDKGQQQSHHQLVTSERRDEPDYKLLGGAAAPDFDHVGGHLPVGSGRGRHPFR